MVDGVHNNVYSDSNSLLFLLMKCWNVANNRAVDILYNDMSNDYYIPWPGIS